MKQTSSLAKLIVFYLILQSGLTLSIILFSLQQDRKASVAEAEEQLFNAVWALIPTVEEHLRESSNLAISKLDAIAKGFRKSSGIRVTVIDVDGKVLIDTDADMSKIENHANRPEIIQAKEYGQGTKTRESESTRLEFHYVAIPVEDHVSKRLGYLRCAMATGPIRNRLNTRSLSFISFAGISTVLATAILFGLGRLMIAPLRDLIAFSKSIAEGKYHQKLGSMRWTGEWKLLGNAFDDMQTELAKRESDLRENGDRLSAVLANMTEGIVAIDGQRRVLFANRAASLLFNVSYQEFVQHPFYEFVRIPVLEDAIEDVFQTHRAAKCELDLGLQPRRIVEIQLAWLSQSDGEVVVIVLHDVTNVRQLETMRRDFVANVSHELKTPLSSIKAYSETLRMGAIDDPQVRTKFVERIEEQTKRLSDLIMDLIQLARIESGIATFEMIDVDLGEIATSRLKAFEEDAEKRHLDLKLTVTEPEIWLRCDNEGLVTILDNLIGNAVKYTPEYGTIEVRCSQDNSTRMAIIEVIDNGLGIAPEHQERVFERFFRVDKSRSSDVSGTGLGLSIVKHLAQSFSGQVALSSRLGKGSTFTVRLPLAEASADQIAS